MGCSRLDFRPPGRTRRLVPTTSHPWTQTLQPGPMGTRPTVASLFVEDVLLPEQARRRRRTSPEVALLAAVLDDAVHTVRAVPTSVQAKDDLRWFASDSHRPFGASWICENLGIDLGRLRAALGSAA